MEYIFRVGNHWTGIDRVLYQENSEENTELSPSKLRILLNSPKFLNILLNNIFLISRKLLKIPPKYRDLWKGQFQMLSSGTHPSCLTLFVENLYCTGVFHASRGDIMVLRNFLTKAAQLSSFTVYISYCCNFQLKQVFWLEENVSRVTGQNSLTPKANNKLNFGLARDQDVHLETAANLNASWRQANMFSRSLLYFWVGKYNKTLIDWPQVKQSVLFPQDSRCSPRRSQAEHWGSRGNKTHCFSWGHLIKCLFIHAWDSPAKLWSGNCLLIQCPQRNLLEFPELESARHLVKKNNHCVSLIKNVANIKSAIGQNSVQLVCCNPWDKKDSVVSVAWSD